MNRAALLSLGVVAGVAGWVYWRRQSGAIGADSFGADIEDVILAGGGFVQTAGTTAGNRRVSFAGVEVVRKWEGLKLYPYDANPAATKTGRAPDWTIGYGHKIQPGEDFGSVISEAKARTLLVNDLGMAEDRVNRNITRTLTQSQFDALVSIAYNLTTKSWLAVAARINKGETAKSVFNRYVYGGGVKLRGLVNRRADEVALYYKDSGGYA